MIALKYAYMNRLGIIWKVRFWFSRFVVRSKILLLQQAPRWSWCLRSMPILWAASMESTGWQIMARRSNPAVACSCKWSFAGTQPCSLVYVLFIPACTLHCESWVVATEVVWLTKPKIVSLVLYRKRLSILNIKHCKFITPWGGNVMLLGEMEGSEETHYCNGSHRVLRCWEWVGFDLRVWGIVYKKQQGWMTNKTSNRLWSPGLASYLPLWPWASHFYLFVPQFAQL